jgi:hypothetical protein
MLKAFVALSITLVVLTIGGGMYGCPQYNVYSAEMNGKAALAQAQQNREITVREAQAKEDAAKHLANAEIERAKGVAQANKIIGDSLKENEAYLRYLWINGLNDSKNDKIIYVPTEANLPILEAGRGLMRATPRSFDPNKSEGNTVTVPLKENK